MALVPLGAMDELALDDPTLLVDLKPDELFNILHRLPTAHEIARLAVLCRAVRDAVRLVLLARPYSDAVVTLTGHAGAVDCVAASRDGHVITASSEERTVKVWHAMDVRAGAVQLERTVALALLPDGSRYLSVDELGRAPWCVITLRTLDCRVERTISRGTSDVTSLAVLPDGEHFVVGTENGDVLLYDLAGSFVHAFGGHHVDDDGDDDHDDDAEWHRNEVNALAVTLDGQHIVSGSWDKLVKMWSVSSKSLVCTCVGHTDIVEAVAVTPDGQRILSSSLKPKVDPDQYRDLTFEERFECDGSGNAEVRVWLADGALERIIPNLHTREVRALVALPDNQHALSGSHDHAVKLFNVNDGAVLRTFKHHKGAVNCLALTPDGRRFVSGSRDKTVCIVYHGTATRSV